MAILCYTRNSNREYELTETVPPSLLRAFRGPEEENVQLTQLTLDTEREDLRYDFADGSFAYTKRVNVTTTDLMYNTGGTESIIMRLAGDSFQIANVLGNLAATPVSSRLQRKRASYINAWLAIKRPDIAAWFKLECLDEDYAIWPEHRQTLPTKMICAMVKLPDGQIVPTTQTTLPVVGMARTPIPVYSDINRPVTQFIDAPLARYEVMGRQIDGNLSCNWTMPDSTRIVRNITASAVELMRQVGRIRGCGNCGTYMDTALEYEHGTDDLCPRCVSRFADRTCNICGTELVIADRRSWALEGSASICPDCQSHAAFCEHCGHAHEISELTTHSNYNRGESRICEHCYEAVEEQMNDIQDYHSGSRDFAFIGNGPIYAGLELEVDEGQRRVELIRKLRELWGKNLCCERDGSLSDRGMEVVLPPIGINEAIGSDLLAKTIQLMQDHGFKGQDAESSCGMHINISRDAFNSVEQARLAGIAYRFSKEFMALSQRKQGHSYAKMPCVENQHPGEAVLTAQDSYAKRYYESNGHYAGVSFRKAEVIEFRIFAMSVKIESVYAKLELVRNLCWWVKNKDSDPETIDDIIKCQENRWLDAYAAKYLKKYKVISTLWAKPEDIERALHLVQHEDNGGMVPATYRKYWLTANDAAPTVQNPLYMRHAQIPDRMFELLKSAALWAGQSFYDAEPRALEA